MRRIDIDQILYWLINVMLTEATADSNSQTKIIATNTWGKQLNEILHVIYIFKK